MPGTLAPAAQVPSNAGLIPNYTAPAASNGIPNKGRVIIHVKVGATATTVTVRGQGKMGDVTVPDRVLLNAATNTERIFIFDDALYTAADGQVQLDFSQVANVTWAIFSIPE